MTEAPPAIKPCKPLKLDELLIQNMNTWGNLQYNIPLRLSNNETRTASSIGLRHIPDISQSLDCVSLPTLHKHLLAYLTSATLRVN